MLKITRPNNTVGHIEDKYLEAVMVKLCGCYTEKQTMNAMANASLVRNGEVVRVNKFAIERVNEWVVVADPGTNRERILNDFQTFEEALSYCKQHTDDQQVCDIFRLQVDGTLTTEF